MADLLSIKTDLRTLSRAKREALELTAADLAEAYRQHRAMAPRRSQGYFSTNRAGTTSSGAASTRVEEHLAVGLYNRQTLTLPDGSPLRLIDYQFPLKAVRADAGIGKVDLIALDQHGTIVVIELKVEGNNEDRRIALIESLIYAAAIEANIERIAAEAEARGFGVKQRRPNIIITGPTAFWSNPTPIPELNQFRSLVCDIARHLEIDIGMMHLDASLKQFGLNGLPPEIAGSCTLSHVFDQ